MVVEEVLEKHKDNFISDWSKSYGNKICDVVVLDSFYCLFHMYMETGYSSCLDELKMLELFPTIEEGRYVNICPLGHENQDRSPGLP